MPITIVTNIDYVLHNDDYVSITITGQKNRHEH